MLAGDKPSVILGQIYYYHIYQVNRNLLRNSQNENNYPDCAVVKTFRFGVNDCK